MPVSVRVPTSVYKVVVTCVCAKDLVKMAQLGSEKLNPFSAGAAAHGLFLQHDAKYKIGVDCLTDTLLPSMRGIDIGVDVAATQNFVGINNTRQYKRRSQVLRRLHVNSTVRQPYRRAQDKP